MQVGVRGNGVLWARSRHVPPRIALWRCGDIYGLLLARAGLVVCAGSTPGLSLTRCSRAPRRGSMSMRLSMAHERKAKPGRATQSRTAMPDAACCRLRAEKWACFQPDGTDQFSSQGGMPAKRLRASLVGGPTPCTMLIVWCMPCACTNAHKKYYNPWRLRRTRHTCNAMQTGHGNRPDGRKCCVVAGNDRPRHCEASALQRSNHVLQHLVPLGGRASLLRVSAQATTCEGHYQDADPCNP